MKSFLTAGMSIVLCMLFSSASFAEEGEKTKYCRFSTAQQIGPLKHIPFLPALLNKITGANKVNSGLDIADTKYAGENIWDTAMKVLNWEIPDLKGDLAELGKEGEAKLLVANHATGLQDGLLIGYITEILAKRSDVKIIYNELLTSIIPHIKDRALELKLSSSFEAQRKNKAAIDEAAAHLKNGGLVILFPAGTVSSVHPRTNPQGKVLENEKMVVTDSAWSSTAANLAISTKADVVPVFFHGQNSKLWHRLDAVDRFLQKIKLQPEDTKFFRMTFGMMNEAFIDKPAETFNVTIGQSIPAWQLVDTPSDLKKSPEVASLTYFLRQQVYKLSGKPELLGGPYKGNVEMLDQITEKARGIFTTNTIASIRKKRNEVGSQIVVERMYDSLDQVKARFESLTRSPIIPTADRAYDIVMEISQKNPDVSLMKHEVKSKGYSYEVLLIEPSQMPLEVLNRLGYDRNETFKKVGEGDVNKYIDTDFHDLNYDQAIIVEHGTKQIIGGYRLGKTAELYARFGLEGIYTNEFIQSPALHFEKYNAIDMGRSFILYNFQGAESEALKVLWMGLAHYLVRHPESFMLKGPVSFSMAYSDLSLAVMVGYFNNVHGKRKLQTVKTQELRDTLLDYNLGMKYDYMESLNKLLSDEAIDKQTYDYAIHLIDPPLEQSEKEGLKKLETFVRGVELNRAAVDMVGKGLLDPVEYANYQRVLFTLERSPEESELVDQLEKLVVDHIGAESSFLFKLPPLPAAYAGLVDGLEIHANSDPVFRTIDVSVDVLTNLINPGVFLRFLGKAGRSDYLPYKLEQNRIAKERGITDEWHTLSDKEKAQVGKE